ncbi:hypothetical protein [Arthrobacter sp. D3-16]
MALDITYLPHMQPISAAELHGLLPVRMLPGTEQPHSVAVCPLIQYEHEHEQEQDDETERHREREPVAGDEQDDGGKEGRSVPCF